MNTDRQLIITLVAPEHYHIQWGTKVRTGFTWDEMLGEVAHLTCPRDGGGWQEKLFCSMRPEEVCKCGRRKNRSDDLCVDCRLIEPAPEQKLGTCTICHQPIYQTIMANLWAHKDASLNLDHVAEPVEEDGE